MSTHRRIRSLVLALVGAAAVARAGSATPASPGVVTAQLSVAGTYPTAVSIVEDGCGNQSVESRTTVVRHSPGATTLRLTHAGIIYNGTIDHRGVFSTTPRVVRGGDSTFTITIAGTFSTSGFDANVTLDVQQSGRPSQCRFVVRWLGTKDGEPNVIPG